MGFFRNWIESFWEKCYWNEKWGHNTTQDDEIIKDINVGKCRTMLPVLLLGLRRQMQEKSKFIISNTMRTMSKHLTKESRLTGTYIHLFILVILRCDTNTLTRSIILENDKIKYVSVLCQCLTHVRHTFNQNCRAIESTSVCLN